MPLRSLAPILVQEPTAIESAHAALFCLPTTSTVIKVVNKANPREPLHVYSSAKASARYLHPDYLIPRMGSICAMIRVRETQIDHVSRATRTVRHHHHRGEGHGLRSMIIF